MSKPKVNLENRIEHADRMIDYYEKLLCSGHSFRLGFYMAKQWRKYLTEDQHNMNELVMFGNALEDGAEMHGSGWLDLTLGVRWWLASLEKSSKE